MSNLEIFCSTVIPTINRPTLPRTIGSVLDQAFEAAGFEVVVVNDSGQPLAAADWQQDARVRVVNTNRRERSVARNSGAAIARGRYLHFLDDDDVLLPGALAAFWALYQATHAAWLYGSYQITDNAGQWVNEFHPAISGNIFALLVAGEGIPLQASLIGAKEFRTAGSFDAHPAITGVEDRDLGRRIALTNAVAFTDTVVASIRVGQQGSSTNWSTIAESDRKGREKALSAPQAYARLAASATSGYWQGRVARALLASMVWNLHQGNMGTALRRALAGLWFTQLRCLKPSFWQGIATGLSK